ncbi:hypothetical protein ACO229_00705 [Promicromonospora sp. MS192]|uniref:hypothetical protein n=1 Tax=Promicromonospora sp. MS192 TaxID=3412684 RepID=UPI003C2BEB6E
MPDDLDDIRTPAKRSLVFVTFVATIVVEAILGKVVEAALARFAPLAVAASAVVLAWLAFRPGGRFHHSRLPSAQVWEVLAARGMVILLTAAYILLTASTHVDGFWPAFATAGCLCTATVIAIRETVSPRPSVSRLICAAATLLVGIAITLIGAEIMSLAIHILRLGVDAPPSSGVLGGVAFMLLGISVLLGGVSSVLGSIKPSAFLLALAGPAFLIVGVHEGGHYGIACVVIGVSTLIIGCVILRGGRLWSRAVLLTLAITPIAYGIAALTVGLYVAGTGILILGCAPTLLSIAALVTRTQMTEITPPMAAAAVLLYCIGLILLGTDSIRLSILFGSALLLGGVAVFLIGTSNLLNKSRQHISAWTTGIGYFLCGLAGLLFGVSFLQGGNTLLGIATIAFGLGALLAGIRRLWAASRLSASWERLLRWLASRPEETEAART